MMREIKSITGLRVISVDEGASVGLVNEVVVDLAQGVVVGLILSDGAAERGVLAADIQTIGTDVIMISSRSVAQPLAELPELASRKSTHPGPVPVFTASGRRLGVISAIAIDPYEKAVSRYEVSAGPIKDLADGILILPIVPGSVHGQDAVIVPDEAVQEMGRESGGLRARFTQWGDSARKQYQQMADSAEKMVDTSAETLKKEAAVVREKAVDLSAKAKEAVTKLGEKEESAAIEAGASGEEATLTVVVEQPEEIVAVEPEQEATSAGDESASVGEDGAAASTEESTKSE